jgi:hypothetical protein
MVGSLALSGRAYNGCERRTPEPARSPKSVSYKRRIHSECATAFRHTFCPCAIATDQIYPVGHCGAPLLSAPSKHHSLEGQEHGRTIPLD